MNSLAHTSWECKYHIVFAPKYRRQVIYGKMKTEIGKILRELCERKGIEIIAAECCPDHIHMLIRIPPKYSVSEIVGYLKGKSSLIIFDRHANLKYKYGNRTFWCRGYYVDTVGKNTKKNREYINNQLKEDWMADQISLSEYIDPFTGEKWTIVNKVDTIYKEKCRVQLLSAVPSTILLFHLVSSFRENYAVSWHYRILRCIRIQITGVPAENDMFYG